MQDIYHTFGKVTKKSCPGFKCGWAFLVLYQYQVEGVPAKKFSIRFGGIKLIDPE
jgi:hypothetical protein